MRRFIGRIITKQVSVRIGCVVIFMMCAVFFITQRRNETIVGLHKRQLNLSEIQKSNRHWNDCREAKLSIDGNFTDPYSCLQRQIKTLKKKLEMYEKLNSLTEFESWVSKFGSKTRQNVLILSDLRSGSTFLGELFNQHPHIFYLYEPLDSLKYYHKNRPENIYDAMSRHLLKDIFHCNYMELSYFTDFLSFQYSSLSHRLASKALSSPPLCPEPGNRPLYFNIRMCTPLRTQTISALCRLHKHTVVKTVLIRDIHKLSYLMDNGGSTDYTLKFVHLVRDPRAMINSRVTHDTDTLWTLEKLRKSARDVCASSLRNIKYAVSAPPWLHGHYTIVRYEDLVTSPQRITEQLYSFLGIAMAAEVRYWIDRVFRSEDKTSSGLSSSVKTIRLKGKNLTESVSRWRRTMPYSIVRAVETECYEVMNLLGYRVVEDEEELRDVSQTLVD